MFSAVLITQRGEAAARVARTCRRLGVRAITLSSAKTGVHVDATDAVVQVDGESISAEAVLAAIEETGADAVHPGYAPDEELARALEASGTPYVGIDPDVLTSLRSRATLLRVAGAAEVRVLPGGPAQDAAGAIAIADDLGYPVLLSGEGATDTICDDDDEVMDGFQGHSWVERALPRRRIIDVLVAADGEGDVAPILDLEQTSTVHECPAAALTFRGDGEAIREAMFDVCARLVSKLEVVGLVRVRLALDVDARFFIVGVELGLPREHAAVEMVTGLDLVELQLRIASGEPLPPKVRALAGSGHALGVVVRAKDKHAEDITDARWPSSPQRSVRVAASVQPGSPMPADDADRLLTVTTFAPIRHQALLTLDRILAGLVIAPQAIATRDARALLGNESFRAGQYDNVTIERILSPQS